MQADIFRYQESYIERFPDLEFFLVFFVDMKLMECALRKATLKQRNSTYTSTGSLLHMLYNSEGRIPDGLKKVCICL